MSFLTRPIKVNPSGFFGKITPDFSPKTETIDDCGVVCDEAKVEPTSSICDDVDLATSETDQEGVFEPALADEDSVFCLDRFVDDGGGPDPVSFAFDDEQAEDSGTPELSLAVATYAPDISLDMVEEDVQAAAFVDQEPGETGPSIQAEVQGADQTKDDFIPELAAVEAGDIVEEIVKINDFDTERDVICVYYSETLDSDTHGPVTAKLNVARIKDGSGQVILLDDMVVAHVDCERHLTFRDVAFLKQ